MPGIYPAVTKSVTNSAVAGTATVGSETPPLNARIIVDSLCATLADAAAATGPLTAVLRDGASGAGTIVWQGGLSGVVSGGAVVTIGPGLGIAMTPGNIATFEFTGAGGAGALTTVAMTYRREDTLNG